MSIGLDDILAALAADRRDRMRERTEEVLRIFDDDEGCEFDYEHGLTLEELLELDEE